MGRLRKFSALLLIYMEVILHVHLFIWHVNTGAGLKARSEEAQGSACRTTLSPVCSQPYSNSAFGLVITVTMWLMLVLKDTWFTSVNLVPKQHGAGIHLAMSLAMPRVCQCSELGWSPSPKSGLSTLGFLDPVLERSPLSCRFPIIQPGGRGDSEITHPPPSFAHHHRLPSKLFSASKQAAKALAKLGAAFSA